MPKYKLFFYLSFDENPVEEVADIGQFSIHGLMALEEFVKNNLNEQGIPALSVDLRLFDNQIHDEHGNRMWCIKIRTENPLPDLAVDLDLIETEIEGHQIMLQTVPPFMLSDDDDNNENENEENENENENNNNNNNNPVNPLQPQNNNPQPPQNVVIPANVPVAVPVQNQYNIEPINFNQNGGKRRKSRRGSKRRIASHKRRVASRRTRKARRNI